MSEASAVRSREMPKSELEASAELVLHSVPVDQEFLLVPQPQDLAGNTQATAEMSGAVAMPAMRLGTAVKLVKAAWTRKEVPQDIPF